MRKGAWLRGPTLLREIPLVRPITADCRGHCPVPPANKTHLPSLGARSFHPTPLSLWQPQRSTLFCSRQNIIIRNGVRVRPRPHPLLYVIIVQARGKIVKRFRGGWAGFRCSTPQGRRRAWRGWRCAAPKDSAPRRRARRRFGRNTRGSPAARRYPAAADCS